MSEPTSKLAPEIAAKIALSESVRVSKLFSEIPKWPIYLIAALGCILTVGVLAIGLLPWAKQVVFSALFILFPIGVTYLFIIVGKVDTLATYLREHQDR